MRKLIIAAVLAGTAFSGHAAEAASVKYYTRQKLANLSQAPAYTYTPAYGAFGTCSGGTQSASITTCTRNDGVVVANSYCTPATKSQSCTASLSCGTLKSGWWASPNPGGNNGSTSVSTSGAVPAACVSLANKNGIAGFCGSYYTGSIYNVYYLNGSGSTNQNLGSSYQGTTCQ